MTTELLPIIDYVPEPMRTFLNTPLQLGQFVPCDEQGNVIDEPDQAATDMVLFDGFEVDGEPSDADAVMVSGNKIGMDFYQNGKVIMWKRHKKNWDFQEEVKTISDLCGYGIKLKQR